MHVDYIKNLSEGYVLTNQSRIKEKLNSEDLFEHFYHVLKETREEFPEVYYEIASYNKFAQEKLFREFYDSTFFEDKYLIKEDLTDEEINELMNITESSTELFALFGFLAVAVFRKKISKSVFKRLYQIYNGINKIGNFLLSRGGAVKLAYLIIQRNSEDCYKSCGVNQQDLSFSHHLLAMGPNTIGGQLGDMFTSQENYDKIMCLRECYLHSLKENIKLQFNLYFTCLKNSGDISRFPDERNLTAFQLVVQNNNFNNVCNQFQNLAVRGLQNFNEVLDVFFSNQESMEKKKKVQDLVSDLYKMKKDIERSQNYVYKPEKPNIKPVYRPEKQYYKPN